MKIESKIAKGKVRKRWPGRGTKPHKVIIKHYLGVCEKRRFETDENSASKLSEEIIKSAFFGNASFDFDQNIKFVAVVNNRDGKKLIIPKEELEDTGFYKYITPKFDDFYREIELNNDKTSIFWVDIVGQSELQ